VKKKITACHSKEKNLILRLERVVKVDEERVMQPLKNAPLGHGVGDLEVEIRTLKTKT